MIEGPYKLPDPWYDHAIRKKRREFWLRTSALIVGGTIGLVVGVWIAVMLS